MFFMFVCKGILVYIMFFYEFSLKKNSSKAIVKSRQCLLKIVNTRYFKNIYLFLSLKNGKIKYKLFRRTAFCCLKAILCINCHALQFWKATNNILEDVRSFVCRCCIKQS